MAKRQFSSQDHSNVMSTAAGSAAIMLAAGKSSILSIGTPKPDGGKVSTSIDKHISGTGLKSADSWDYRQINKNLKFAPGQHPGGHSKEAEAQFKNDTKHWGDAEWEAFQKMSRIAADSSWAMAHHNQPSQSWKNFQTMSDQLGGKLSPKDEQVIVNGQSVKKSDVAKFAAVFSKLSPDDKQAWIEANKQADLHPISGSSVGQGQHPGAPGAKQIITIKDASGKEKKVTGNDLDKFGNAYGKLTPEQQKSWNKLMAENHAALSQRGGESQSMKNFKSGAISSEQANKIKAISSDPKKKAAFESWVNAASSNKSKMDDIKADPAKARAFNAWVTKSAAFDKHSKNAIFGKYDSPLPTSPVKRNVVR